jgi:transcriptional regulator
MPGGVSGRPQGYVTPSWYAEQAGDDAEGGADLELRLPCRPGAGRASSRTPAWLRRQMERPDAQAAGRARRAQPWAVDDAPEDYLAAQMKAIVGIEIPIARIEGKWKLSQNRDGGRPALGSSPAWATRATRTAIRRSPIGWKSG